MKSSTFFLPAVYNSLLRGLFLLILYQFSSSKCFSQAGWFQQNSHAYFNLNSVCFVNANTGYVVGDSGNIVLKTIDGGLGWVRLIVSSSGETRRTSVFFLDAETGYVAAYVDQGAHVYGGAVRTYNGGQTWNTVGINSYFFFANCVFYLNSFTGYVVGTTGGVAIYKTTNSGSNWEFQWLGSQSGEANSAFFPSSSVGYVVGTRIYRTTNSALTWTRSDSGLSNSLRSVYFLDNNVGYCVGDAGTLLKTTNGSTWSAQVTNTGSNLYSVFFANYNTGYVVGQGGLILKTTNGGNNWLIQNSGTSNALKSVFFIGTEIGYAVGANGTILKTTTGGVTFIQSISSSVPDGFKLYQNYPNPFNPLTKINFALPKKSFVNLIIYDPLGRTVAELVNQNLEPGTYAVDWDGSAFPSGIYFYSLLSENYRETKRMVLIK